MPDNFPRPFGKYTLLEPLAKGGMGSLYLACLGEAGLEKLCVVKTVLRELADKEYIARFRDEAKVVVRLSHGNLVPVFDAGNAAGELYIAMEHIDGKDLRAVWNRCAKKQIAFPVDVAIHLIKELCRGLFHAHGFGDLRLVHRDVSPPNVLIAFSGEVKLTDFGLASSTLKLERTAPGVIYGKVSYMSPEQARGEALDGRTDMFAAAVILWELLTGRQLFPSGEDNTLEKVRDPKIDPPSSRATRVTRALDAIVMKALSPNRGDRYADCEAFRAALAQYLAHEAPETDAARVAIFLRSLFDDEIDDDRKRRDQLVEAARAGKPGPRKPPSDSQPQDDDGEGLAGVDLSGPSSAGILGTLVDGRYQVNRLIGEGGMGRVYEAEHVDIGKRVAMKVLHPSYTRHPEAVLRFRREARAAAKLGHANIVDVTDSGTTPEGAVYFVMEFLEGRDLADVIAEAGNLSIERTIHVGVQMARALHAAHAAGIIHRDLKPENVFLVQRGEQADFVKVLDFGIARNAEYAAVAGKQRRLTNPGMAMGTPEYMAPEQAAGQVADARSDVYAAGAMLYEMLSGQPPHTGANFMEVLSRKASDEPIPLGRLRADVSPELVAIITAALSRNPAARPQSMEELALGLERCRPDRRATRLAAPLHVDGVTSASVAGEVAAVAAAAMARPGRALAIATATVLALLFAGAALYRAAAKPSESIVPERASRKHGATLPPAAATTPSSRSAPTPPTNDSIAIAPQAVAPPEKARAAAPDPTRRDRHASPSSPPVPSLAEAEALLEDHQLGAAERAFHGQLAGSDRGAAATGMARVAFERGFYVDAIHWGERAVHDGGGYGAHFILGDACYKALKYDAAAREFRAVLKLRPDDGEAQKHLDAALRKLGS